MAFVTISQKKRINEEKINEDKHLFKTYFDFDNPDIETNWKLLQHNQESIYKINTLLNTLAKYTRAKQAKEGNRRGITRRRSPTSPVNVQLLFAFKIDHLQDTGVRFPNMEKIKLLKQLLAHSKKQYLSPLSEFVYDTPDTNTSPTRKRIKKKRRKRFRKTFKSRNFEKMVTARYADRLHPEKKTGGRRRRRKTRRKKRKSKRKRRK